MSAQSDWGIGKPAPALNLPQADGEPFSLEKLKGLPVLVSFLSHAA